MPWNEPGRGSGGGDDRDPWKGGNGQQPPDLDEVFANVQRRLKKIMGGGDDGERGSGSAGGPSFGGILLLVALLLVIWVAFTSIHIIDESERGVVLRFGEHARNLNPGLNFTLPTPVEEVIKVNVSRVSSLENQSRMLTGDENLIDLAYAIQYRIVEPESFLFNVQDPIDSLSQAADSSIREIIGTNDMDYILEVGRNQIALDSQMLLEEVISRYQPGIEITSFNLQEVRPPSQVRQAFDDVVRAREDQIRFANEAQAYANQEVPEARGRAARILEEARGYQESVIARATGEADRFISIYTEYAQAPEVTRERLYLETLERVYGRSSKILMDVDGSNNMFYLPLDRLGGNASATAPPPPLMLPSDQQRGRESTTDPRARSGREGR
ncbi:FtsH protease activity modulator HflK [Wenzhouxiangella marina]|uniref:Protein HflK n=1 Tax=Wenzhouxiangella marina TaxID=1579979 RepID=A0A0K0XVM8_9GAMM|nr:FtsH protease activity modulator HflK [Wenzhouxiangella marina]AKS41692.1 HflK protein [Wenzhouxiangella marina]MBB6086547.1 membrane protease subunit HflK [Wenzhouxiangella marina]